MWSSQMEQVAAAVLSAVAGAAAAWATLQSRVTRVEELVAELKADKASKESLDAVRDAVDRLRDDLDKRFDRIELAIHAIGKGSHNV
jgi:enoyl-[acyl-carrier-protein] reductase (NADH)